MTATKTGVTSNYWVDHYLEALLGGDKRAAVKVVDRLLEMGVSTLDIDLNVFTPALERVGELWCAGSITVADERLATEITISVMDRLRSGMKAPQRKSNRILISCVEGERHYVGARMVADLFLMNGWQVDFLGPDVPTSALSAMVLRRRPQLVGLSVTRPQNKIHVANVIRELAGSKMPFVILLGGRAVSPDDRWETRGINVAVAANARIGLELARELLRVESPHAVLEEYLKRLGILVRRLRSEAGWTQQKLAQVARLTRAYVVAVEGGKQNVTMDVVIRLANALGVAPNYLFEAANDLR